jgi:hypothetical protein
VYGCVNDLPLLLPPPHVPLSFHLREKSLVGKIIEMGWMLKRLSRLDQLRYLELVLGSRVAPSLHEEGAHGARAVNPVSRHCRTGGTEVATIAVKQQRKARKQKERERRKQSACAVTTIKIVNTGLQGPLLHQS